MPTAMSSPLGFLVSRGRAALLAPRQRAVMNRASAPVRMWEILDPWVVDIKIVTYHLRLLVILSVAIGFARQIQSRSRS